MNVERRHMARKVAAFNDEGSRIWRRRHEALQFIWP
jgi:hypothetical protein